MINKNQTTTTIISLLEKQAANLTQINNKRNAELELANKFASAIKATFFETAQPTIQSVVEQYGEIKHIVIDNRIIANKDDDKDFFQVAMNLANKKSQSGGIKAFAFSRINGIVKLYVAFSYLTKAVAI